jgi:membrane protein
MSPPTEFWKRARILSWKQILGTIGRRVLTDQVLNRAAELAFWFLLGFFPMLLAVAGIGSMLIGGSGSQSTLTNYVGEALPANASSLVTSIVNQTTGGGRAWLSLLFALWSSSSAITGVMTTLNAIYGIKEDRAWWRARLVALVLAIGTGTVLVSTLVIVVYGPELLVAVLPGTISVYVWKVAQWPAAAALLMAALFCLYRFAPNVKKQRWQLLVPGSIVAALIWIVASLMFKLYVRDFSNFGLLYGSLGTLVILMFWFYLGGAAILIGGEINSTLEEALRPKQNSPWHARSDGAAKQV